MDQLERMKRRGRDMGGLGSHGLSAALFVRKRRADREAYFGVYANYKGVVQNSGRALWKGCSRGEVSGALFGGKPREAVTNA
jgi:hypothetical protein